MNKLQKSILKRVFLIIPFVFILVATSFAWFNYKKDVTIDNLNNNVIKVNATEISTSETEWDFSNQLEIEYPKDFEFSPIAGDGVNFFSPILEDVEVCNEQTNACSLVTKVTGYINITNSKLLQRHMIYQNFYMKNDYHVNLYLKPETTFVSPSDKENMTITNKGVIAGAMRVSLLRKNEEGNFEPCFIWIPNATYHLDATGTYSFNVDGTVEEKYYFINSLDKEDPSKTNGVEITTDNKSCGYKKVGETYYIWGDLNKIEGLSDLVIDKQTAGVEHYRLVMWLDGNDRECDPIFMGGTIRSQISLRTE